MEIPWQNRAALKAVNSVFTCLDQNRGRQFDPLRETACHILELLEKTDPLLDEFCRLTCPECMDNCCVRATIWYDFRDLLFFYFSGRPLPDRQVSKKTGVCVFLGRSGCVLPRLKRPFVCTWYLCADQKNLAGAKPVLDRIKAIQDLRKGMEEDFIRITAGD